MMLFTWLYCLVGLANYVNGINLRKEASNLSFFDEYRLQSELNRQHNLEHFNSKCKYKYENKLLHYLFKNYNPNIIPREFKNESLKLNIGLAMIQLVNVYEREQVMKTNVWMHMWWYDFQLKWSHMEEYNHITSLRVPYNKVWTPDMLLFNNADDAYDVSYKTNVVLYQGGHILWIPPAIYKSTCQLDIKYFPYDEQVCELVFGSWIYNSNELNLDYFENMKTIDLNEYVPSGSWDIVEVPAFIISNDNSTKTQMIYKVKMKRKTLFYTVNLIIPTFLLSCLTVCVFYLPTEEGEKITFSLSVLFALIVYLLLLVKLLPPSSVVVPLISKYLIFAFIMNVLSVFTTCIVINCYYRQPNINLIHPWLRILFVEILPRIVFIKRPEHFLLNDELLSKLYVKETNKFRRLSFKYSIYKDYYNKRMKSLDIADMATPPTTPNIIKPDVQSSMQNISTLYKIENLNKLMKLSKVDLNSHNDVVTLSTSLNELSFNLDTLEKDLQMRSEYLTKKSVEAIDYISSLMNEKRDIEIARNDWKVLSEVIDRFLLVIFLLVTFIGTLILLSSAP